MRLRLAERPRDDDEVPWWEPAPWDREAAG